MTAVRFRIKIGIWALALALLGVLALLRVAGVDDRLVKILAAASALLVALLLITYRAFAGVIDAARDGTLGPPPDDEDDR